MDPGDKTLVFVCSKQDIIFIIPVYVVLIWCISPNTFLYLKERESLRTMWSKEPTAHFAPGPPSKIIQP